MRHALEPDHLTAVSVLAVEHRGRGAMLGALWGVGHSLALLGVGLTLGLLQARLPPSLADAFELAVAVMLVILGGRALRRALREGGVGPANTHSHRRGEHEHAGPSAHLHLGQWTFASRPLIVGLIHGLAGSGALTALAVASLKNPGDRIAFVVLFGCGSIFGMAALSGLAGWPLAHLGRSGRASRAVCGAAGALSTVLGLAWGWPLALKFFA
jgi:hypothetical protein